MTIQRIEAKLDALISALGFDVMIGSVCAGDYIKTFSAKVYSFEAIQNMYPDKAVDSNGEEIVVSEPKQEVKLVKRAK